MKKGVPALSVVVGSGVTYDNCHKYRLADALVVGSHFKEGGRSVVMCFSLHLIFLGIRGSCVFRDYST